MLSDELLCDIVEWDTVNWGRFIEFIDNAEIDFTEKKVLDIGARNGGLSLYCALKGALVTCSDLDGPTEEAEKLHKRYEVDTRINYKNIDATKISEEFYERFDVIIFKSVLGGIGSFDNIDNQIKCVESIKRCLKPGGKVIFAENMRASVLHNIARRLFRNWGNIWHYESRKEIVNFFKDFILIDEKYVGFLGCFGRKESCRKKWGGGRYEIR